MALNKKWSIAFLEKAERQLTKLDKTTQKQITNYLKKVISSPNPHAKGSALQGNLKSYWRYRVGDYRILCQFKDDVLTIMVIKIAHRKDVYTKTI